MRDPTTESSLIPTADSSLSAPEAKWGDAIKAGYQVLPDALVRGQRLLKLSATDVVVIANLNQAWWFQDRLPYLQPHTIAKRMGVSERSVQRSLSRLRTLGYLKQVRQRQIDGTIRYYHDLSGLRERLAVLAHRDMRYSEKSRGNVYEQSREV
jgi:predicted transcriptional regulator